MLKRRQHPGLVAARGLGAAPKSALSPHTPCRGWLLATAAFPARLSSAAPPGELGRCHEPRRAGGGAKLVHGPKPPLAEPWD